MKAENGNGSVVLEYDQSTDLFDNYGGTFVVTAHTKWKTGDCMARFNCYDLAEQLFKSIAAEQLHAQEITVLIDHFNWMTRNMEDEEE